VLDATRDEASDTDQIRSQRIEEFQAYFILLAEARNFSTLKGGGWPALVRYVAESRYKMPN
jgi:hypothetical protein